MKNRYLRKVIKMSNSSRFESWLPVLLDTEIPVPFQRRKRFTWNKTFSNNNLDFILSERCLYRFHLFFDENIMREYDSNRTPVIYLSWYFSILLKFSMFQTETPSHSPLFPCATAINKQQLKIYPKSSRLYTLLLRGGKCGIYHSIKKWTLRS